MNTPIYTVELPEYKLSKLHDDNSTYDGEIFKLTPWYNIKIPNVYFEKKPDFAKFGKIIDDELKKHFLGKHVVLRVIGSMEHPNKSIDELISIISTTGTDRYDPFRKGDRYENLENKKIDFFALDFVIDKNEGYSENFLEPFYFWAVADRGYPIRIDIMIIYDYSKLEQVEHTYQGRENEIKRDGFCFKDQNNKNKAILGIIKIL